MTQEKMFLLMASLAFCSRSVPVWAFQRLMDLSAVHALAGSGIGLGLEAGTRLHYLCTFRLWSSKSPIASSMLWSSDLVSRTM